MVSPSTATEAVANALPESVESVTSPGLCDHVHVEGTWIATVASV